MKGKILVVDDDSMNLKFVTRLLNGTELTADTAICGSDALKLTLENSYDAILTDHLMPGMDGIELLNAIKTQENGKNRSIPVIVLTGNAEADSARIYAEAGFNGYLEKPVMKASLLDMLGKFIGSGQNAPAVDEKTPVSTVSTAANAEAPSNTASSAQTGTAWYMGIEGIDGKTAINNLGSEGTLKSVMKLFYDSISDKHDELDGYFNSGDWNNYTVKVHALKSSSKLVGALKVSEEAEKLENAGKQQDIAYIKDNHAALMKDFLSLKKPLSAIYEGAAPVSAPEKPTADKNLLESVYEAIKEAALEKDDETIEEAIDELNDYIVPADVDRKLKMIRFKASSLEFDDILQMIEGMLL